MQFTYFTSLGSVAVLISILVGSKFYLGRQPTAPESHHYAVLHDFISNTAESKLRAHFESMSSFPRAAADFSSKLYTSIGEEYAPDYNYSHPCYKLGTTLNPTTNLCVFLPRFDLILHFAFTGGYEGFKESEKTLMARQASFIKHEFEAYSSSSVYNSLFTTDNTQYTSAIRDICPANRPFIKPIELNLGVQLPGQGILAHRDAVYFTDATRHTHPLWLLQVMKVSGLFEQKVIPQIQGVLYIGDNNKEGGQLFLYPNGTDHEVRLVPPKSRTVVLMDGTEIVHGTVTYQPSILPLMDLKDDSSVKWDQDVKKWRVFTGGKKTEHTYEWGDVRASIAYRALCFESEESMSSWSEYESGVSVEEVLDTFRDDLVHKGATSTEEWDELDRYEVGEMLVNYYVKLPGPELAWIPWNYHLAKDAFCSKMTSMGGWVSVLPWEATIC